MDDSYINQPPDPTKGKIVKWLLTLLLVRAKNPIRLTAFLSLHPLIRDLLFTWIRNYSKGKHQGTVDRRTKKLSNFMSSSILFLAICNNQQIPKDYLLIYLYMAYFVQLHPPTSRINLSPTLTKAIGLDSIKKNAFVRKLYSRKHLLIFPVIFAQLLSNYLTPTRFKLNHKYLSSSIKNYIFNPIWKNFTLGANYQRVHWLGLFSVYVKHNVLLFAFFFASSFKTRFLNQWYNEFEETSRHRVSHLIKKLLIYAAHRANSMSNFIYGPNLLSMLLLSLTAPALTRVNFLRDVYLRNTKSFIKAYIKTIAFVASLTTLGLSSILSIPAYGHSFQPDENLNIREISPHFYNELNLYLFKLMILSKWRILKNNHPWFKHVKVANWDRLESLILCYGVWTLMNLNDYVRHYPLQKECQTLEKEPLIRAINSIME